MGYQALYRTWRPTRFAEIMGQERIVTTLVNQITSGRIPHAYLFCGSRGTGKTTTAKVLSRAINCQNPQGGEPCGECEACRQLSGENNLDIVEIDAASNNGVDEIRDLREKVKYPPTVGKYKVYIIDEVHMLSSGAFNALLKTLEEPPAHAVFILATTEPQKLPATILSRCQRFDFHRITMPVIEQQLRKVLASGGYEAEDEAVALIARAAEGGMRDALSILDMCLSYTSGKLETGLVREVLGASDRSFLFAFVGDLIQGDAAAALTKIDQLMREGRDPVVFTREVIGHLRSLLLALSAQSGLEELLEVTPEDAQALTEQAFSSSQARLMRLMSLFIAAEGDMRWASQQRAVLELCAVRACHPEEETSREALEDRLAALEKAVSEGAVASPAARPAKAAKSGRAEEAPAAPKPVKRAPPANDQEAYNTAMKLLFTADPRIAMLMRKGVFTGVTDDCAVVEFPGDGSDVNADLLAQPAKKEAIEKALTEAFGKPMHVRFATHTPKAPAPPKNAGEKLSAVYDAFPREGIELTDE